MATSPVPMFELIEYSMFTWMTWPRGAVVGVTVTFSTEALPVVETGQIWEVR